MIYRGLGSGIIRVMKENIRVDFINEESANQFRTIVWRTTQKSEDTIQKSEGTTQKDLSTTQKKVLDFFKDNPKANRAEAAQVMGDITEDGIKFIIAKLQRLGLLKREGGRKTGVWVVVDKTKNNE